MRRAMGWILAAAAAGGGAQAQGLAEAWRLGGFAMPESAYYDAGSGQVVVSQIGAFGPEAGADGSLSLVSTGGEMLDAQWVTGLVDPKGMASHGGKLYVADADGLKVVDIATGALEAPVEMPGAMMLNDVAVGADGTVYVTDMFANAVWRLRDGAVDQVVAPGGVALPNGILAASDGTLLLGSFGDEMGENFAVNRPGGLLALDAAAGTVAAIAGTEESASVDGIAELGGWVVYDDNPSGRILGWRDGELVTLGETAPGAADLGSTGELLLVPNLTSGEVVAYRIE